MTNLSWATLTRAIEWIAYNDNEGSAERLDAAAIAGYISVLLVADLFERQPAAIAARVVSLRRGMTEATGG